MFRIAHLTSVHFLFDTRIFYKECKTLAAAGYEVVFIVPHDKDMVVDNVKVRAVPKAKKRWERMTSTVWHVYRAALSVDAGIYHFHDSELIPVGLLLKLKGKKVIYDIHEDLPRQIMGKHWIPRWLRGLVGKIAGIIETLGALVFDGIVGATPLISGRFPPQKTITVHNFPLYEGNFSSGDAAYRERDPIIVYIGGLTVNRGIMELVQAMALIPEELGARLILAGNFCPPGLEQELRQLSGWERVINMGWIGREEILGLLAKAKIGMCTLHDEPNYFSQPFAVKMFEYMSSGIPIVASDFPAWREFLEPLGCVAFVNPRDIRAIADKIIWYLENPSVAEKMGGRGREAVIHNYNWQHESKKLVGLYEEVLR